MSPHSLPFTGSTSPESSLPNFVKTSCFHTSQPTPRGNTHAHTHTHTHTGTYIQYRRTINLGTRWRQQTRSAVWRSAGLLCGPAVANFFLNTEIPTHSRHFSVRGFMSLRWQSPTGRTTDQEIWNEVLCSIKRRPTITQPNSKLIRRPRFVRETLGTATHAASTAYSHLDRTATYAETLSVPHYWPLSQQLRTQTGSNLWRILWDIGQKPASCCGTVRCASLPAFKIGYNVVWSPRYAIMEDCTHY